MNELSGQMVVSDAGAKSDRPETILENLANQTLNNMGRLNGINLAMAQILARLDGPIPAAVPNASEPTAEKPTALQRTLGATDQITATLDDISQKIDRLNVIV